MAATRHGDGANGFSELIGLELGEPGDGQASGTVPVGDHLLQPFGIVHGGVYAALAESVTSHATWLAVRDQGMVAMGQANQATFLRPITEGRVHAWATARHRGRTTWVWDVEVVDDEGRLCALVRMTIAVRPAAA